MNRKSIVATIIMTQALFIGSAQAEDTSVTGLYLQGVIGTSFPDESDYSYVGGGLSIGYRASSWFAAELQAMYQANTGGSGAAIGQYTVDTKLYPMPLLSGGSGRTAIEPYLTVGLGGLSSFSDSSDTETGFLWKIGLGTDWMLTEKWGFFAEYDYGEASFDSGEFSRSAVTLGTTFRF